MDTQSTVGRLTDSGTEGGSLDGAMKGIAPKLAFALVSALLCRASLPGGYSPFGAGFMATVPPQYAAVAAVGGILSCLTDTSTVATLDSLRHISVIIAIGGIRWALGELRRINRARFYPFFAALAGVLLTNTVINGTAGSLISYSSLFFLLEGFMAGLMAMLFSDAANAFGQERRRSLLSKRSSISAIVLLCAVMIPLCRWEIFGISPGMILVHTAVLLVLPSKREMGGAVSGIAAGCVSALSLYNPVLGAICPAAALLAGFTAVYGRVFSASAYIAVCFMGSMTGDRLNYSMLTEVAAAGIISCLIPAGFAERALNFAGFSDMVADRPAVFGRTADHSAVTARLSEAAAALTGVSSVVEQVSDKLSKLHSPDTDTAYHLAISKVCSGCAYASKCGIGSRRNITLQGLSDMIRRRGAINGTDISGLTGRKCPHENILAGEINTRHGYHLADQSANRRISQVRSVINDQLEGIGLMLTELSEEIGALGSDDEHSAAEIASSLRNCGYSPELVRCSRNRNGRTKVTLKLKAADYVDLERDEIGEYVGEILGCEFRQPKFDGDDCEFTVELVQKQRYTLAFGGVQHCCSGERLCGDAFDTFLDGEGCAYMIISDGMGSGGHAAVDGAMACGLLSRLLRGGFGWESAVRIVNSSLLIKSEDESLSTIDSLRLNLYNGRATFCKAGAAQSYHLRNGLVHQIDIESLPLGILRETDTAQYSFHVEEGDLIVMISDGVPTDETMWFENLLKSYNGEPVKEFADFLLKRAVQHRPSGEDDDITVLVAQILAF